MFKDKTYHHLTYASFFILALSLFVSFTVSAGHHILLFLPGIWFLIKSIREKEFILSKSSLALVVVVLIAILSIIFNDVPNGFRIAMKLRYFLYGILAIFALKYWFKDSYSDKKVRLIINIFLITTTIASISGLIALYSGFNPLRMKNACHIERTCGMYGMFMTYAYGIQFFLLIATGLAIFRNKLNNIVNTNILYIALFVNAISFYLSYARGAFLGFLLALPFFLFRNNKKKFLIVFFLVFIFSSLSLLFIPKFKDFITHIDRRTSMNHRISQYQLALEVVKQKPLLGIGYRNLEPNAVRLKNQWKIPFEWRGGHSHSNFFEHLATTGIFGFLALVLFHFFWAIECYRRNDVLGDITFPFVIALFISGQFQYTLGDGENLFLIMVVYAISHINYKKGVEN